MWGLLSQHLNSRPDHGSDPAALGRGDVETFLNRVAYLEATGEISRYRRNMICRDVRAVLAGIRALGLARPASLPPGWLVTSPSDAPTSQPTRSAASLAATCRQRS